MKTIIEAIRNAWKTTEFIALHEPVFPGNEQKYVTEAIESTFVSSVGAFVNRFEEVMAGVAGVKRSVAVVNGTAALQVGLRLVGVERGDEVITQALTFVATANAITYNGAIPVFVDVNSDTMSMSPLALRQFLEEFGDIREDGCYNKSTGRRIKACLPMHTFGFMARIDQIKTICENWRIELMEDAAEALGSEYQGQKAGSFGKTAAFSFNGNKIVTAGGGGAITTNDEAIADLAKHLTTTAKKPHAWEYAHDQTGYNYRMPNLNAALIVAQMEQLKGFIEKKRALYAEYQEIFQSGDIQLKPVPEDTTWNHWLMSVQLTDRQAREQFLQESNKSGVMTRPIWQLMYRLPMFDTCQRDDQTNAEFLESTIVNIPSGVRLSFE